MLEQRDIVLVPIPFTDLTSTKRRPVVVVSNNEYNREAQDIVVVAMTSNLQAAKYGITVTASELEKGTLNRPSKIRCDKIYTLAQSVVVKTFGRLNSNAFDQIRDQVQGLMTPGK